MARMKDLAHDLGITDYTATPTDAEIVEWLEANARQCQNIDGLLEWIAVRVPGRGSLRLAVIAAMRAEKGAGK